MKIFLKELKVVFILFLMVFVTSTVCFLVFSDGKRIGNSLICFWVVVFIHGGFTGFKMQECEEDRSKLALRLGLRVAILTLAAYLCLMAVATSLGIRQATALFLVILLCMEVGLYIGVICGLIVRHARRSHVDTKTTT